MKRIIYISGIVTSFFYSSCFLTTKTVIYELPSNYSGRVVVEFDCKDPPNLKTDNDGNLIINVDSTGRVVTSFSYLTFAEKYNKEKYRWSGEEKNYSIILTSLKSPSRIGSSWSGGRSTPQKRTVIVRGEDTIVTYTGIDETKLQYYCTYVFKSTDEDFKGKIMDSIKKIKCDCDSYTEQYPYDKRCNK